MGVGATLQDDGTWLGASQICEWYTGDDICGVSSSITEAGATTSLTDASINIGEEQSTTSMEDRTTTSRTTRISRMLSSSLAPPVPTLPSLWTKPAHTLHPMVYMRSST